MSELNMVLVKTMFDTISVDLGIVDFGRPVVLQPIAHNKQDQEGATAAAELTKAGMTNEAAP